MSFSSVGGVETCVKSCAKTILFKPVFFFENEFIALYSNKATCFSIVIQIGGKNPSQARIPPKYPRFLRYLKFFGKVRKKLTKKLDKWEAVSRAPVASRAVRAPQER
jgi:hypothetical protein